MTESTSADLSRFPIHLGRGGNATRQPAFTGDPAWYLAYGERAEADGAEGWLVTQHTFTASWDVWEMHPNGHEIVICQSGTVTLHQEHADGTTDTVVLSEGGYAINPPGTWHTADCDGATTCTFVTSGMGTDHRPR